IYNRVVAGDLLQLDSTVHYAVDGTTNRVFTSDEQRNIDSPYNTYRFPGLPPGPIDSPGEAALEAALNPTPGDWTFFVTVNLETGETLFATSLAQHNANVAKLQEYCESSDLC
ncbi:MAG: endolytic transglycosylase MltG, partial [Nocardioidaceae bacterium]